MTLEIQMLLGLAIGIAVLIWLVIKTKIHAFLALIIAASITGLVGGMEPLNVVNSMTSGFGNTLASIGMVVGLGVMMGRILEVTGAAEKLAYSLIRIVGKKKEEWAMAVAGYIVSIPIFVDSAFVILNPLVKSLSLKTGKSVVTLGVALAIGLAATHHAVPPTPGPLGVAGIFGVDIGQMILWGLIFSIPIIIVGVFYAQWLGKRIYQLPAEDGEGFVRKDSADMVYNDFLESSAEREKELPSLFLSFLPILTPIVLIFLNTTLTALEITGGGWDYVLFLGQPIIALAIGLVAAIYGLAHYMKREEALERMEEGMATAGIILLVTGAGGALGTVLRDSGTGDYLAEIIARMPLPAILIPFFIASIVRLIQGSGTVAMITAASISAPILVNMDINLVLAAQAAALGAMLFSYFNDSLFWVVNRMLGITKLKEQIMVWSIPTTLAWLTSLVMLLIANAFFG